MKPLSWHCLGVAVVRPATVLPHVCGRRQCRPACCTVSRRIGTYPFSVTVSLRFGSFVAAMDENLDWKLPCFNIAKTTNAAFLL